MASSARGAMRLQRQQQGLLGYSNAPLVPAASAPELQLPFGIHQHADVRGDRALFRDDVRTTHLPDGSRYGARQLVVKASNVLVTVLCVLPPQIHPDLCTGLTSPHVLAQRRSQ